MNITYKTEIYIYMLLPVLIGRKIHTLRKKGGQKRVIGLHQNRPAHASKLTRFRLGCQYMLVSLPGCAGKLTRNLVNLLAYEGRLWICKFACLCGLVLMQYRLNQIEILMINIEDDLHFNCKLTVKFGV